jgi:hypothetical protein
VADKQTNGQSEKLCSAHYIILRNLKFLLLIGKGPSIWDTQCHNGKIDNKDTGDIACDSYHKFREDIKIMSDMKVPSVLSHNNLTCATLLCCLDGMVCSLN